MIELLNLEARYALLRAEKTAIGDELSRARAQRDIAIVVAGAELAVGLCMLFASWAR